MCAINFLTKALIHAVEELQKKVTSKIVLIHQEDLQNDSQSFLCGMTRALLGEGFPNKSSCIKICNPNYMVKNAVLEEGLYQKISMFIRQLDSVFNCLYTNELQEYDDKVQRKKVKKVDGVIGGHSENLYILGKYFIKKMSDNHFINELFNYYLIPKKFERMRKFTPRCFGAFFCRESEKITLELIENVMQGRVQNSKNFRFIPFDQ